MFIRRQIFNLTCPVFQIELNSAKYMCSHADKYCEGTVNWCDLSWIEKRCYYPKLSIFGFHYSIQVDKRFRANQSALFIEIVTKFASADKGRASFYKHRSDIHARHWATNDSVQNSLSCPGGLNRPSSAPSIVAPTAYAALEAYNDKIGLKLGRHTCINGNNDGFGR